MNLGHLNDYVYIKCKKTILIVSKVSNTFVRAHTSCMYYDMKKVEGPKVM